MMDEPVFLKTDARAVWRPECRSAATPDVVQGVKRGNLPGAFERRVEIARILKLDDDGLLSELRRQQTIHFFAEHYNARDRRLTPITGQEVQDLMEEGGGNWEIFRGRYQLDIPERREAFCKTMRLDLERELSSLDAASEEPVAYPKTTHVVVANRGEVACRIIEAAHESGKKVIVLHDGRDLPYAGLLAEEDHLYYVPCFRDTSRSGDQRHDILALHALAHFLKTRGLNLNCVAVHPGWGFNAENDEWVATLEQLGFRMVGPHSKIIAYLGAKTRAVELAREAGLSTPASSGKLVGRKALGDNADLDNEWQNILAATVDFYRQATENKITLLLLKDALGGGGAGQLLLTHPSEEEMVNAVRQYWETYREFSVDQFLPATRHVEFQVLCDVAGNVRFGSPRDCTLQRARQKFNEESAELPANLRQRMEERITAFLKYVQVKTGAFYVGAGTFEFLFDPVAEDFFFMEVNTRLQVENCVSSSVDGIHYFLTQLDLADGRLLADAESLRAMSGATPRFAVQARICLERLAGDEEREAISKTLKTDMECVPVGGADVFLTRMDLPRRPGVFLFADDRLLKQIELHGRAHVPRGFDSMVAKVVAVGSDAEEARLLLANAVGEMKIEGPGIHTNRELILTSLAHAHRGDPLKLAERRLVSDVLVILRGKMRLEKIRHEIHHEPRELLHRILLVIRPDALTEQQWTLLASVVRELGGDGPFCGASEPDDPDEGSNVSFFSKLLGALGFANVLRGREVAIRPAFFRYFCAQLRHITGRNPEDLIENYEERQAAGQSGDLDMAYLQALLHHETFLHRLVTELCHQNQDWEMIESAETGEAPAYGTLSAILSGFERMAGDVVRQDLWVGEILVDSMNEFVKSLMPEVHPEWRPHPGDEGRHGYLLPALILSEQAWTVLKQRSYYHHLSPVEGRWYVPQAVMPLVGAYLRRELGDNDLRKYVSIRLATGSHTMHSAH